ncbi:MAG: CRTAC1 family protein [Bryobacterales bacterium]|nr:CRTAC1 family protein [Acidobacteriota bacterium]MCB9384766.1 CRTAC1 family protein [Bryobacterales bacterium]
MTKARALALCALAFLAACSAEPESAETPGVATTERSDVVFSDATAAAGVAFQHFNGRSGKKLLPETLGSGVAFFDCNQDGWADLYFVNSRSFLEAGEAPTGKLYVNTQDGKFREETQSSGLAQSFYGLGAAAADYDNDGDVDLYVTAYGPDRLYRNRGNCVFEEVAAASGIANPALGTSAVFVDYDKDGLLDLFVNNYVQWSPEQDLWCTLDGSVKTYCTPESYSGVASKLYRSKGDGTFEDVSEAAGVADPTSKALGVVVFDFNRDGWPDLFQANDTEPNKLYQNNGDGTFRDIGLTAGVAFAEDGKARGAMGVDAADYDGSGREHLLVGNFSNEMLNLFHNEGNGLFVDEAPSSAVGRETLLTLTFGAFFFDYDLDGLLDIFLANGHLDEEINNVQPKVTYSQPPQLFRNLGAGRFVLATKDVGEQLERPLVARGAAYADFDHDGDEDLVITTNDGPAYLYRNDGGNANSHLRIVLRGVSSNRSGLGAVVVVRSPSGVQRRMLRTGSSYLSQSESVLTFGVSDDLMIDAVEIEWPSGKKQLFSDIESNRTILIDEQAGIVDPS